MEITCDTNVDSLLKITTVDELVTAKINQHKKLIDLYCITPIVNEMAEDKGLGTYALNIVGQAPLCNKAMSILEKFENVKSSLDEMYKRIMETAEEQSALEAEALINAINTKIEEINGEIETNQNNVNNIQQGNVIVSGASVVIENINDTISNLETTKQKYISKLKTINRYQAQGILGK